jgi:hypothetical protein
LKNELTVYFKGFKIIRAGGNDEASADTAFAGR